MVEDRNDPGDIMFPGMKLIAAPELTPRVPDRKCGIYWTVLKRWIPGRQAIGPDLWRPISHAIKKRAGNRCEICGSENDLETHERYTIAGKTVLLTRLLCVCRKCHQIIHFPNFCIQECKSHDPENCMGYASIKRFAKLNQMSFEDADKLLFDGFDAFRQKKWRIKYFDFSIFVDSFNFMPEFRDRLVFKFWQTKPGLRQFQDIDFVETDMAAATDEPENAETGQKAV